LAVAPLPPADERLDRPAGRASRHRFDSSPASTTETLTRVTNTNKISIDVGMMIASCVRFDKPVDDRAEAVPPS
jgi:hypothetical protein